MKLITALLAITLLSLTALPLDAKKIKESYKIEKDSKASTHTLKDAKFKGREIVYSDSLNVGFSGYDKEPNSSQESFILMNSTDKTVTGFNVRIEYLDMQDRMLHSREVKLPCYVPEGENRRFDINSWDTQHTYYYYLGNAPKRVATPFQVKFTPLSIWVEL